MKDQIQYIRWSDGTDKYLLRTIPGEDSRMAELTRTMNGEERTMHMDVGCRSRVLEEVAALIEGPGTPPEPPLLSEVILADKSLRYPPAEELQAILDGAWVDCEMLLESFRGTQIMGLVMAPNFTAPTPSMADLLPPPQKTNTPGSVWNADGTWECSCGSKGNTGKFCPECGSPMPPKFWECPNCGAKELSGRFCPECGTMRP
ncbi:MAG: zinc ribbon domain-containing protein [Oscillospiraceae bacterium]|nr:zinc ribbon domain-containing protein [Oscillospiraceae bacterium]